KKVVGEKIREQMSKRRRATQLACGNPTIGLTPLPTGSGTALQPFLQITGGHWINIDADILSKETREGLQTSAFKIVVNIFKRSNCQRETHGEAHRRPCVAVH